MPVGVVCCELRGAGMRWPAWDTFAATDTSRDCRVTAPSDMNKFLIKRETLLRWTKKQINERENGVWLEPMRTPLEENVL